MDTENQPDTLRMVLLGTTGSGKSSTGNTICGGRVFTTNSTDGQPSFECTKETADINGQWLSIVDTPGFFDPNKSDVEVEREIAKGVTLAAPGPHVLLVVIRSDKYTNDEQKAVKIIQRMFGKEGSCYTMVLFTHGDDLEANAIPIDDIVDQTPDLCAFIRQCGGGYHVFNNRDDDPSLVRELLEKIKILVEENGGSYYTNDLRLDMGYKDRLATAVAIGSAIGGVFATVALTADSYCTFAAFAAGPGAATGAAMAAVGAGAGAIAGAAAGATAATFVVVATPVLATKVGDSVAAAATVAAAAAGAIGVAAFLAASAIGRIVGAGVGVTVSAAAGAGAFAGACAGFTFFYSHVELVIPCLPASLNNDSNDFKFGVITVIFGGGVCCAAAAGAVVGAYIDKANARADAGADAVDRRVAVAVAAAGAAAGVLGMATVVGAAIHAGDLVALGVAVRVVRASAAILFESGFAKEAIISVASVAMLWWLKRK